MQVCASLLKSGREHGKGLEMGQVGVEGHMLDGCEGIRSVSNCRQKREEEKKNQGYLFAVSVVNKRLDKIFLTVVAMPGSYALERTPPSLIKDQPQGSVNSAELGVSTIAFYESCCGFSCILALDGS